MPYQLRAARAVLACAVAALFLAPVPAAVHAQPADDFVPVTDAMLEDPAPADWLSWRRTPDGWGFSPLDQIDRENVGALQMVWSRGLTAGSQEGTPLAYDGVLYMPNPGDVIQAIDAVTGDLRWEYRRDSPDDIEEYVGGLTTNRNIAIHGRYIIDTSIDNHVFALDAATGRLAWETAILDYRTNPARHSSGPIIAGGRVVSGRSCMPRGGPDACVITAHYAATGAEVWRRRTIPAPGEPGDETWGGIPFEERVHVGSWMAPSYDPALNLVYVGTSVTSPAPKFLLGGAENQHLYHNSTLALDGDTGEIVWYYQHLNDHWDLDHPFERLLVDTAVAPDPAAVSWINPRLEPGAVRQVLTGIPGKTGIVYTLDRATGEFLWARPTVTQNVITAIDGATGDVTENAEVVFSAEGQEVLACPTWIGGKDWEAGAYSPRTNTMYMPLRNACARMMATRDGGMGSLRARGAQPVRAGPRPARHRPGHLRGDRRHRVALRAAGGHHVTRGDRRRTRVRGRRERAFPRLRRRDRRGAVGDQPRLGRHRLPDHLRGRRPAVRGGQHRHRGDRVGLHSPDPGDKPQRREHPVRVRSAGRGVSDLAGVVVVVAALARPFSCSSCRTQSDPAPGTPCSCSL